MLELKRNDIIAAAQLDPTSVHYALKHPEHLRGMPTSGSQGVHRMFSVEQAFWLALFSTIVRHGFPLPAARNAVKYAKIRLDQLRRAGERLETPPPGMSHENVWLWIVNGSWLTVDLPTLRRSASPLEFGGVSVRDLVSDRAPAHTWVELALNCTQLWRVLRQAAESKS